MPCKAHVYPNGRFELWLTHPNDQIYFRLWERFIKDQHTLAGRKRKWVSSYFGYKVRLNDPPPPPPPLPPQDRSDRDHHLDRDHQPKRARLSEDRDSSGPAGGSTS